jgi:riboflavin-specific deaminase-like protein
MQHAQESSAGTGACDSVPISRLLAAPSGITVDEFLQGLALESVRAEGASSRPHVMLNMVSTADGRASIGGRSGPIGNRADELLFHGLRSVVDAVLVGAGTIRAERYGRLIKSEQTVRARRERGLAEQPLACIASGSVSLPADIPLLADSAARIVILTPSQATLAAASASISYVRAEREGRLDIPRALAELSERFGVRTLLCEGGPHLNHWLLSAGVVDELFLSLAPKLAGGESAGGLRIIAGTELEPPVELELLSVLESESELFLRYGVRDSTSGRVCSATMRSTSLAS